MTQHIGCYLRDEGGNQIADSQLNCAEIISVLRAVDTRKEKFIWLHTIDEHGNTTFNHLQTHYVIQEFQQLCKEVEFDLQNEILRVTEFLSGTRHHEYIVFVGD